MSKLSNDSTDQDYRFSHYGEGSFSDSYDQKLFREGSYDRCIWEKEKEILRKIIEENGIKRERYLDFACGTGRVLSFLERQFRNSIGLDISPTMLEKAKNKVSKSRLICGDATKDPSIVSGTFDCITSFRFFLNAQPELRNEAMSFISTKLKDSDSLFIFNIHGNKISSRWFMVMLNKLRGIPLNAMSLKEVQDLVARNGLEIVDWFGTNYLDKSFYNYMPKKLWFFIERIWGAPIS